MTAIKLDKVKYCNLVDTYINYETASANIVVSGSVGAGATATFSVSVPYSRTKTRADIYLKNLTTGVKMPTSQGARVSPYTFAGSETYSHAVSYNGSAVTVTISIFNGGGSPLALTAQTLQAQIVAYHVPYIA